MKKLLFLILIIAIIYIYYKPQENISDLKSILPKIEIPVSKTINFVKDAEKEISNPPPLISKEKYSNSILTISGVLKWTNYNRNQNGSLPSLNENKMLNEIANDRLADMFSKQYFEHISPKGVGASDIAKKGGYEFITIGENIALGNFKNDEALVKAWMDSPGHRANILNSRYSEIGIAAKKGIYDGNETWIAVQIFALPLSACPAPSESLKNQIESAKLEIAKIENSASRVKNELEKMRPITKEEIELYNKKVNEYNQMVQSANSLYEKAKKLVAEFNLKVSIFNKCAQSK